MPLECINFAWIVALCVGIAMLVYPDYMARNMWRPQGEDPDGIFNDYTYRGVVRVMGCAWILFGLGALGSDLSGCNVSQVNRTTPSQVHYVPLNILLAASMGGVYLVLGIVSSVFFRRNRDAELKRKVFRVLLPLSGVLFVLVGLVGVWPHLEVLVFSVPITVLICWWTWRNTRFCAACGSTVQHRRDCPKCGVPLSP